MRNLTTKNKLLLVVLFFSTILSLLVLVEYNGSKILYLTFSFISFYFLIFQLRKNSIFFDNFMGIFFWIGFWVNFSLKTKLKNIFPDGIGDLKYWFSDGVGNFNFSSDANDKVLVICIVAYFAIILSSYIREFFFIYKKNNSLEVDIYFYKDHKVKIISIFFIVLFFFTFINFNFEIYQRGLISDHSRIVNLFFTFILTIFLPCVVCMILNYEYRTNKSLKFSIFLSIIESFLNSTSVLSRNFIFNPFSQLIGIIKLNSFFIKFKENIFFIFFILMGLFFMLTIIVTSNLRNEVIKIKILKDDKFDNNSILVSDYRSKNFKNKNINGIATVLISRLIGIEGIMAVSSSEQLSFQLLSDAFKEKFTINKNSFYNSFKKENRVLSPCPELNEKCKNKKINSISLMGIVAFLFYSGSYIFLFTTLIIICLFCSVIEIIAYKVSHNLILCSLISQLLAYRLWHFGYLPSNSYKLILAIFMILLIIFLYRLTLKKFYKTLK